MRRTLLVLPLAAAFYGSFVASITGSGDVTGTRISATFEYTRLGNVVYQNIKVESSNGVSTKSYRVSTHSRPSGPQCGYWSDWTLAEVNATTRERLYLVHIYDACNNNERVFPPPGPDGPCNYPPGQGYAALEYSMCPTFAANHVPAGLAPTRGGCAAESDASTALLADLNPRTYDRQRGSTLTAVTSFSSDFTDRLSEGTCMGKLDWTDMGWLMSWTDGAFDTAPASGKQGITDTHTLAPDPNASSGTVNTDVTAVAHLHLTGQAIDFDQNGNLIVVPRDANVDISNKQSATGLLPAPTYTPPQLAAGAIAIDQLGDGTLPPYDPTVPASAHANTIRGRLLQLYPRALVLRPGHESVGGVVIGQAQTETIAWTYMGGPTDAPPTEATPVNAQGTPTDPVSVQYNHAEQLDSQRNPVDERVPILIRTRTTYPDGHVEEETTVGAVAVTIYYVALAFDR